MGARCEERRGPKCLECARTFILWPEGPRYDEKTRAQVRAAYQDRMSTRGIRRTFGVLLPDPDEVGGGKK